MRRRWLALAACLTVVVGLPGALAEEDPFADEGDPFAGDDPFAEYEQQAENTTEATQALTDDGDGGDDDASEENTSTDGEGSSTNDTPAPGGLLLVAAIATAALAKPED